MMSTEEEAHPFFNSLDATEAQHAASDTRSSFMARLASFMASKSAPAPPPTVVVAPTPSAPAPVVMTKGWSCRAVLVIVLLAIMATLLGILIWIGVYGRGATVESMSNTATSFLTRYAAIQQHHVILAHFDVYGDEPTASDLRTETASMKSFARIVGSVDLHTLRFDWNLRVNDAHYKLGPRMTIALWVQRYDVATHLMKHTTHSPLVLCANLTTSTPCVGHLDHPAADLTTSDELDPRILSLALYEASRFPTINQTSVPVWIKEIV